MVTGAIYHSQIDTAYTQDVEALLNGFYAFSVSVKRIKTETAFAEMKHVGYFLQYVSEYQSGTIDIAAITAQDVRNYVVNRLCDLKPSLQGRLITSIRNFFKYQQFCDISVHPSIFKIPLSPAVWKLSEVPATLESNIFKQLSDIPNQNTNAGIRDKAIILCFTDLALRCIEVASLTLDDINWHDGLVIIKNTKTRADRKLPFSEKLGSAIIQYLKYARPITNERILFVRFKHKCGQPMGREQIRDVVRQIYAKAGIDKNVTGTHILRKTAASEIYNAGNSLKMTADILGHASLDSTICYTKADMISLQQVASAWPGGDFHA